METSFSRIPQVLLPKEILDKCFRRGKKVEMAKHPDRVAAVRNWDIAKLKAMEKCAKETLERYLKGFPDLRTLDRFHRELFSVLVDENAYRRALGSVKWARDSIVKITTSTVKSLERTRDTDEFSRIMNSYFGRFSSFIDQIGDDLEFLRESRKSLVNIPDIDTEVYTIVVAGFPNVGKSELVKAISTGKPEVAPYPFTTKGIYVGHMVIGNESVQVVDTPGLLDRRLEERNRMERQAIVALRYLADLVLFVLDPSETCGYRLDMQLSLLEEVRRFLEKDIIVVENKMDIFVRDSEYLKISAKERINLDLLMKEIEKKVTGDGKDRNT
ncbi:MAG: NOG1 family protein [Thermoplasmata archaeon]